MEELLKFVESEIDRVNSFKLYMIDENGEDYDGEGIFHDGWVIGMYEAYTDMRDKILKLSATMSNGGRPKESYADWCEKLGK